jgi:hypothetical protein
VEIFAEDKLKAAAQFQSAELALSYTRILVPQPLETQGHNRTNGIAPINHDYVIFLCSLKIGRESEIKKA